VVDPALPAFNVAALRWHQAFLAEAAAMGFTVIVSQSYELLAQHCPAAWQQRTWEGVAGLTGWSPPSALLSPAHSGGDGMGAQGWRVAGGAVAGCGGCRYAIRWGEPWWWVTAERKICIYDDAARGGVWRKSCQYSPILGPV
jgi:hypothetical protein